MRNITIGDIVSKANIEKCGQKKYPVLSMTMHDGIVFQDNRFKKQIASVDQSGYNIVKRNQLVVSFPIDEGVLAIQDITDIGIVSPAYKIWNVNQDRVIPKYLEYFLRSPHSIQFYKSKLRGSTARRRSITNGDFLSMELPSISLEQQHHVLKTIDQVERIKQNITLELLLIDNLVKSRFIEMFGDPDLGRKGNNWKPISSIGTVIGGATPKTSIDEYWDGEYRWITPAELDNASWYIYDSARKLTKAGVNSCSLTELPIGTVILTSRAPIGKVAIAGNTFYCNQGFKNIVCGELIHPVFLYELLLLNNRYLNSLGRGATFTEISKNIVENIMIPVPPYARQLDFAEFCMQINKSRDAIKRSLDETQLLFDSLMQEYFG